MPITSKTVKGTKYLYFNWYDPEKKRKKEEYCGPADNPKAVEKANELERNYIKSQISTLQNHLKDYELTAEKTIKRRFSTRNKAGSNRFYPRTEEVLRIFKGTKMYEPRICYKSSERMTEVEDESIQLVVTSPPYNVGKEYAKHDDNMDLDGYLAFLYRVWTECKRVLCKGGRIAINVADTGRQPYIPLHSLIIDQLLKLNFSMRGVIIWDKGATVGVSTAWGSWRSAGNPTLRDTGEHIVVMDKPDETDRPILRYHEPIVVFSKDAYKLQSKNMISTITSDQFTEYTKSIWRISAETSKNGHPAPFPEELPKRLIQLYTFLGDTVLDPFLGSGTTCKVAKAWGRTSVGYEIDESYRPIIEARLAEVEELAIPLDSFTNVSTRHIDDFEHAQVA